MQPVRKVFDELESLAAGGGRGQLEGVVIDPITTSDMKVAISRTKPSAQLLAKRYLEWQNQYAST